MKQSFLEQEQVDPRKKHSSRNSIIKEAENSLSKGNDTSKQSIGKSGISVSGTP